MALLFAYGVSGFLTGDFSQLRSRSNLIALMWLVVAIVEFFGYGLYASCFGYASEKMVCGGGTGLTHRCVELDIPVSRPF